MNCTTTTAIDPQDNKTLNVTVRDKGLSGSKTYKVTVTALTTGGVKIKGPIDVQLTGSTPSTVPVTFTHQVVSLIGMDYDDGSGGGGAAPSGAGGHCCCCALLEQLVKLLGKERAGATARRSRKAARKKARRGSR